MNWLIGYLIIGAVWSIYDNVKQWREGIITRLDRDVGLGVLVGCLIWPLLLFITWAVSDKDDPHL